jgi:hypothetical protein
VLSFHGRPDLKASVSAQMHQHLKEAALGVVVLGGQRLHLYEWGEGIDYRRCEDVLGIPQALMRLGVCLTEGFPDGREMIREVVRQRRRFIDALPVGVDLGGVAVHYLSWLVLDPELGPARFVDSALLVDATLRVADLLSDAPRGADPDGPVRAAGEAVGEAHARLAEEQSRQLREPQPAARTAAELEERRAELRTSEARVSAAASLVAAVRFAAGDVRAIADVVAPLEAGRRDDLLVGRLLAVLAEVGGEGAPGDSPTP